MRQIKSKRKWLFLLIPVILILGAGVIYFYRPEMIPAAVLPQKHYTHVLIDPGHGGSDVGAIATVSGAYESDLNLAVAKKLGDALEAAQCSVEYTRSDARALALTKEEDMSARSAKIADLSDGCMVSIHMNSFTDSSVWGPQVFYQEGSEDSKLLALKVQDALNRATGGSRRALAADYMVLRSAVQPAVLVECGFLTNEAEEEKLLDTEYQLLLAQTIASVLAS